MYHRGAVRSREEPGVTGMVTAVTKQTTISTIDMEREAINSVNMTIFYQIISLRASLARQYSWSMLEVILSFL